MKMIFRPEVLEYFNELSTILYEKDYFGFEEDAMKYVDDLMNDIKTTLHSRQKRLAPSYFDKYGKNMHYSVFRRSRQTQWYIFFTIYDYKGEIVYLIRYISNNHMTAQYL